ncbi:ABC transporter substrate-binding protein SapA [Sodalis sp.]|uniref:ABC transporter substrate-binding protein SapA n=1 Tax=Sodalis sp. (in: enterobacteria) TaxID=1898979 RepID=UPI003872E4AA
MSTQSDYSLTRAAVTLLAALLLTAGTAREAGAAGSQSCGDNVTGSDIPAARAPNAAQRRAGAVPADAAFKPADMAVEVAAKSAGMTVDDAAKPQVLATEAASEPDVVAAGAGPDAAPVTPRSNAAPAPLPPIRQSGFVYCVSGMVTTFNPQMASSGVTVDTLSAQLYDRLLAVDPYTYRLIPELAQRWEVLDNGATYRFHLRKNIAFQRTAWFTPTRTLNADDVVFSFARMLDAHHPWHAVNGGDYPYFDSLQFPQTVQSVKRIDNDTVEFRLESPDASFLWHLATHYAPVLSAEYADRLTASGHQEQLDRLPVGTGPFMLNEYHSGQFIRLTRHEYYWRGKPRMAQVVIDLSSGGIGRLSRLLTGECDVLAYPAASQLSILRDDPRLRLTLRPGMNIAYLAFNTRKPPLNDVRLRHAIALAINNPRLMQSIYYGTAETAASLLPRASWAYDNDARVTEYNPAKARALLRELGKPSLQLNLLVPTASQSYNPSPLKTAELIQADLAQVGIRLTIIPVEGRFQEARLTAVNHDMTLSGWSTDSNDPDSFFRPLLSCAAIGSQTNYARWCDPAFDALLHRALFSQQLASRIGAYHEAQRMLAQQLPVLPLASSLRLQAYRYGIRGLVLSPFGNASFAGVYRDERQEQTP